MKKFFFVCLFAAMTLVAAQAQDVKDQAQSEPTNGAKIKFTEMEHDYGTIAKGSNGNCEFESTNEGNEPLVLSKVRASCGCTTPSYTDKPVMPGQKGTIKVHYNTNSVGGFNKSITVNSNAVNTPTVTLRIRGKVEGVTPEAGNAQPAQKQPVQPQKSISPKAPEKVEAPVKANK